MSIYFDNLVSAMFLLAEQPNSIFIGQAVQYPGTAIYNTLKHLPENKRKELPVCENMQTGIAIGMSLQGYLPISIYPRFNFLLSTTDQLVNHLDVLSTISQNEYIPKLIIRTAIGSEQPLYPSEQHVGDFTKAFSSMLNYVHVVRLDSAKDIIPQYRKALQYPHSTILVEWADRYNNE